MKKILSNNLGLKILAVMIAVILWMAVVNISDPVTTTKYYDVPVTYRNEEAISDAGLVYMVNDNTDKVRVTLKAPRSVLSNIDKSDISIVADMSKRTATQTVPLEISVKKYNNKIEDITMDHYDLALDVENLVTRQIAVELSTEGIPMKGYAVGDVSAAPNVITISGPESVMNDVEHVRALLKVDNCYETVQANCRISVLDKKDKEVDRSRLSFNDEDIMVTASFLPTKTIDLKFATNGTTASGYGIVSITSDPEVITICGEAPDIANLSVINIPGDNLDVSNLDKDLSKTINVEQFLPDNVKILSSDGGNVKVTVSIKKLSERTIEIPVSSVVVKNIKTGYNFNLVDENGNALTSVPIKLLGLKDTIDKITESDIKVVIDLKNLGKGKQRVQAQISSPNGITTEENWILVEITK